MVRKIKKEIRAYGISVLLSRHPEIRRLKRDNIPTIYGNKFWTSSWLLMDYFKCLGLAEGSRVMEIGCGWGLAGIYCAKKHGAVVTAVDIDQDVFPFSRLHAKINKVDITFMKKGFEGLRAGHLRNIDTLIAADICFWDNMTDSLKRLITRARRAGVKLVLIADPVRSPFEELCQYFVDKKEGELLDWSVKRPRKIRGQILKISSAG
ncbi:class I SAM-dependent methyltransferase [Deltaproteobacteria bacterium]|nr:class I SAM-dependent methyltransferase [Deltaproteobacteria bacterium]